jgi:hypothetical protein
MENEDSGNLYGIDQSVSYLSNNLNNGIYPIPNYANIRANLPSFSIPKAQRFTGESLHSIPGPGAYSPIDDLLNIYEEHKTTKKE